MSDQKKIVGEERRLKIVDGLKRAIYPETAADVPDSLAHTLENVIAGTCDNKDYIRSNISYAASQILEGQPLYGEHREFIGQALLQIGSEGFDANIAFKLKTGHKPKANKVDESRITMMVMWKVNVHKIPTQRAFAEVGDLPTVLKSQSAVCKIYYKHRERIEAELLANLPNS